MGPFEIKLDSNTEFALPRTFRAARLFPISTTGKNQIGTHIRREGIQKEIPLESTLLFLGRCYKNSISSFEQRRTISG